MPEVVRLLQDLIRFDTTNPPGHERACVLFIKKRLEAAGIPCRIFASHPDRPNLLARVRGRSSGGKRPLLLYGHVDVVPTAGQKWKHPAFAGKLIQGEVWGRGALDMKSGVAMYLDTILRAAREPLAGDLLLLVLSDEEAGGEAGAAFMAEQHAGALRGVRHALGEIGGWTQHMAGKRMYPIMLAEKQSCHVRATVHGPGGHASLRHTGGAMAKTASVLATLDRRRLPVHITPAARLMVRALANALGGLKGLAVRQLLSPALTDRILDRMGTEGRILDAVLHNTATATVIRGGTKVNVVPSEISIMLDCRVLPGFGPKHLLRELSTLLGPDVKFAVERWIPGGAKTDASQYDMLARVLREHDPGCHPYPILVPACTDGRHLARIGIQTYGFTPLRLPRRFDRYSLIHAADERVPAAAVEWGTRVLWDAVRQY